MCNIFKETFSENQENSKDDISIGHNKSKIDKQLFQLCLFKFGILDNIYKIYNQFSKNNYITKFLPSKKQKN